MDLLFNHQEIEEKWFQKWTQKGLFTSEPFTKTESVNQETFTLILPPPNVTGQLHIGHALNGTIQDVAYRYNRMKGKKVLWIPGTDHAGIATQNVVTKKLLKDGLNPNTLTQEEFLKEIEKVKETNHQIITSQIKRLGLSCDWTKEQYTKSPKFNQLVNQVFGKLWQKGLIYRDYKPVNWCPKCLTALSNDEVTSNEQKSQMYYLKYYFKNSEDYLVIATTRPETIFGDNAIAYHPSDPRKDQLKGKSVLIPLLGKEIPLIESDLVKPDFGTGLVKITPAHSDLDFQINQKEKREFNFVLDPKGKLQNCPSKYLGMDRFKARSTIIKDLQNQNFLEKSEPHQNVIGSCYRCQTVLEMYLSSQVFLSLKDMKEKAKKALKEIIILPEYQSKLYLNWLNDERDWCISRQIIWGHPVPLSRCLNCQEDFFNPDFTLKKCPKCSSTNFENSSDVLDTWFSSCLWPFGVFDTEDEYLVRYPIDLLVTGADILFFWVIRMIMMSLEMGHEIPFKKIYLHGIIRAKDNRKMSKSLDNSIDPLQVIDQFGADSCRYTLLMATPYRGDAKIDLNSFGLGRGLCVKLWNSARYLMINLGNLKFDLKLELESLGQIDIWILSKFRVLVGKVNHLLTKSYNLNEVATLIYDFYWNYYCSQYLEFKKFSIQEPETQKIMVWILEKVLRLLHPLIPFLTEEIYSSYLKKYLSGISENKLLLELEYPSDTDFDFIGQVKVPNLEIVFEVISKIRDLKMSYQINPKESNLKVTLIKTNSDLDQTFETYAQDILGMTKLNSFTIQDQRSLGQVLKLNVKYLELEVEVDCSLNLEKKKETLEKKIQANQKSIQKAEGLYQKLIDNNKNTEKARENFYILKKQKEQLQKQMSELKKMIQLSI